MSEHKALSAQEIAVTRAMALDRLNYIQEERAKLEALGKGLSLTQIVDETRLKEKVRLLDALAQRDEKIEQLEQARRWVNADESVPEMLYSIDGDDEQVVEFSDNVLLRYIIPHFFEAWKQVKQPSSKAAFEDVCVANYCDGIWVHGETDQVIPHPLRWCPIPPDAPEATNA